MQHTTAPGDDDYVYVEHLEVKDVRVVYDPSFLACAHDYSCPVCREKHAVLSGKDGLMIPCWGCQEDYELVKKDKRNWFQKLFGASHAK